MAVRAARCLLATFMAAMMLLSACATFGGNREKDVLTWGIWGGYEEFLKLCQESCPDIGLEILSYTGSNRTGYSWAQMRGDDIPDIFITSQILDKELARERLVDLSGQPFMSQFPTAVLDQVAIDGGVYLLPVNYVMYGIYYNKTLMEENGWEVPADFAQLEALCGKIREKGLIPGILGTQLTGNAFSAVFNLAKTDWLTTPEGLAWEKEFLAGTAAAEGMWEGTMEYVQRYIETGMFTTDPEDRGNPNLVLDYLGNRKAVFCTMVLPVNITELPDTGDKLGMMPYIGKDGSKNIYMYNPGSYIGISRRLLEPGNEKKLENAIRILSLLYSPKGQDCFISQETPCVMSALNSADVPEDSLIYDAHQAMREGKAFPMTYVGWENVLTDIGQAYKEWFRGENGMDGPGCITRMDELQQSHMDNSQLLYFCESKEDFTVEETGQLFGKALGSAEEADAAVIPVGGYWIQGMELKAGITSKLYAGKINREIANMICPAYDAGYAVATMTGAQVKELVQAGLDINGEGAVFPYVLVTRGGGELEEDTEYKVVFLIGSYTEEAAQTYQIQEIKGSVKEIWYTYLQEQQVVSPEGNPWE